MLRGTAGRTGRCDGTGTTRRSAPEALALRLSEPTLLVGDGAAGIDRRTPVCRRRRASCRRPPAVGALGLSRDDGLTASVRPRLTALVFDRRRRSSSAVPSLTLDRMRPEDLDEVLPIERGVVLDALVAGAFLYEMQQNRVARCWVMRQDDGRVIAYLCLWEVADEMHVTNVAVRPDARRQGIARTPARRTVAGGRAQPPVQDSRAGGPPEQPPRTDALRVVRLPGRRPPAWVTTTTPARTPRSWRSPSERCRRLQRNPAAR